MTGQQENREEGEKMPVVGDLEVARGRRGEFDWHGAPSECEMVPTTIAEVPVLSERRVAPTPLPEYRQSSATVSSNLKCSATQPFRHNRRAQCHASRQMTSHPRVG